MASPKGVTYLLHLERPLSPGHTAQHYTGWTDALDARLAEHAAGRGARFTQVALERGIGWRLARTWPGETRRDERRHKTGAHGARLCLICREARRRAGKEGTR
jgi:predicted GIY-YIG superfamily endonuclease